MNILLFTQYFYPEIGAAPNRAAAHSRYWVNSGHNVTVVTSVPNSPFGIFFPKYKNKLIQQESWEGINIIRVWTVPAGKNDFTIKRIISFMTYVISSLLGVYRLNTPDIVIASAPYLSGIPGLVAAKYHKVPLIYEMRDPWIQVNMENKKLIFINFIYKLLYILEKFIIEKSAFVVVIGKFMADNIKREYKIKYAPRVIYNGASIRLWDDSNKVVILKRQLDELNGKFVVGFMGNINNAYDVEVVIEAAVALKSANCVFLFVGEGAQKAAFLKKVERLGLKNIRFYPAVPYYEISTWFELCDLTVVPLKSNDIYHVYIPVKIFESMAVGRSVLFGGNGEAKYIIEKSQGGAVFSPGNCKQLINLIKERMKNRNLLKEEGEAGKKFITEHFTREIMAENYLKIMADVLKTSDKMITFSKDGP